MQEEILIKYLQFLGNWVSSNLSAMDIEEKKVAQNKNDSFFWNLYARCYDSIYHLMPYRKLLWDTLQALDLKPGMKILDAGCGTGNFELFTSEKNIPPVEIEAIDFSSVLLSRAITRCKNLDYVNFNLADLNQKLGYPDRSFDRILCLNTLQKLQSPTFIFQELSRVLKPGGKLIITESKPYPEIASIGKEQIRRIGNVWRISRKSAIALKTLPILSAFALVSVLHNSHWINRDNNEQETRFSPKEDFVPFFKKSEFQGVNISPAFADQSHFVRAVKFPSLEYQIGGNYPLIFKLAETKEEMEEMYKLRFRIFCEKKRYLDPENYSFGAEKDEYDPYSIHFIALNSRGSTIGTIRLILNSEVGFPVEKYFNLDISKRVPRRRNSAEISRLSVLSQQTNTNDPVAFGLYKACYDFSIEHGITHWLAILDRIILRYYNYVGFVFKQIGEPRNCLGGITAPHLLPLSETMSNLNQKSPNIHEFFYKPFSGIFNDKLSKGNKRKPPLESQSQRDSL